MTPVLLVYPFFRPFPDLTIFRQPPLGVSYVAGSLREAGYPVRLLDCTFLSRREALVRAREARARVVGIYGMVSMVDDTLLMARALRGSCELLIAGGPLPTCNPEAFLEDFDVVVMGEGEQTMKEVLHAHEQGTDLRAVPGLALKDGDGIVRTAARRPAEDLDAIPFPARDLLPNERYIRFGRRRFGRSMTTVMSTRGCPYACEFCSNVIFGGSYRQRSPGNVLDEVAQALALGYDGISFADDVFTMDRGRVAELCGQIRRRGMRFPWECLGRVDAMDDGMAADMKRAGCTMVFFGIESGSEGTLALMNKKITPVQARRAVETARRAGLRVGAFFILFYPGETQEAVLETLRFATSLPLDYLGLTMPYPLPGTALYERVSDRIVRPWRPRDSVLVNHVLTFDADFSEAKMWFGILKGHVQFEMRKRLGPLAGPLMKLFEKPTDLLLKMMR